MVLSGDQRVAGSGGGYVRSCGGGGRQGVRGAGPHAAWGAARRSPVWGTPALWTQNASQQLMHPDTRAPHGPLLSHGH